MQCSYEPSLRMSANYLPEQERKVVEGLGQWLDSLHVMLTLSVRRFEPEKAADLDIPDWVRKCSLRLEDTIFGHVNATLSEVVFTPYRMGYAIGLMRWGDDALKKPLNPALKRLSKRARLSARAKRKINKLLYDFAVTHDLYPWLGKPVSKFIPIEHREKVRRLDKMAGESSAEYHHGLADGLRGLGEKSPHDKSTLATDVHLALLMWWRIVSRFRSVTELHRWLTRILGPQRVGDKKRIEKICQRIGLRFRSRGRPRKNQTPPRKPDGIK